VLVVLATQLQFNEIREVQNLGMIISNSSVLLHSLIKPFVSGTKGVFCCF
jgi:hypothetical protein